MTNAAAAPSTRELDLNYLWHGNLQHQDLRSRPPLEIVRGEGTLVRQYRLWPASDR
jgi:hypothetical protein